MRKNKRIKKIGFIALVIILCCSVSACDFQEYKRKKGMANNADNKFLSEIETSILERMKTTSEENFDKETVVNAELFHIEQFKDKTFYDDELKNLALKYIDGLNTQKESLKKAYKFEQQVGWQKGMVARYEVLNELYTNYGLLKDNSKFVATYISGFEKEKNLLTAYEAIEEDLSSQISDDLIWKYDGTNINYTFKNNTDYTFSTVWEITYLDTEETIVGNEQDFIENIKPGNSYVVSFYVPNPDKTDHFEYNSYYTSVKRDESKEEFTAKGQTTLMGFLNASSNNGYDIVEPKRNGNYVNAKAKNEDSIFEIRYLVENQRVYSIDIQLGNNEIKSQDFQKCVFGLAKSINPSLADDNLKQYIDKALSEPNKKIIENDTMFLFDEGKGTFTVSY